MGHNYRVHLAGFKWGRNCRVHTLRLTGLVVQLLGTMAVKAAALLSSLFLSFLRSFSFLFHSISTIRICLYLFFFLHSVFVAGFSRLVVVCWGCCTTFCPRMLISVFLKRGETLNLGVLLMSISQAWPQPLQPPPTCIYTQQSWEAPAQQELDMKTERREAMLCSQLSQMLYDEYAMKVCQKPGDHCHRLKFPFSFCTKPNSSKQRTWWHRLVLHYWRCVVVILILLRGEVAFTFEQNQDSDSII